MSIVLLRFPSVETAPNNRSRQCPYCESKIIQSWGQQSKTIRDSEAQEIVIHRYRCCNCGRTFRTYPEGVDRSLLSQRMHNLAALTFAMGLSVKQVTEAFSKLGINMSRMTVYRDGREMAGRLDQQGVRQYKQIYLMERTQITHDWLRAGVRLIIDVGPGQYLVLGILDEYNPRAVQHWLEPVCRDIGAQVTVMETGRLAALPPKT